MYAGRIGYGAGMPTSLGENPVYNLAEVSESGYGPYLGNIFDDIARRAQQVRDLASRASQVKEGDAQIVVIPTTQGLAKQAPSLSAMVPWLIGGAALLYFGMRKRR